MRILFDHSIFVLQQYGGISRYFTQLSTHLAALSGAEVSVWMGLHINAYSLPRDHQGLAKFGALRRPAIRGTHRPAMAISNWLFKRFARRVTPQIYHATAYTSLLRSYAGKRVITVQDLIDERFNVSAAPAPIQARQAIFDRMDGIICPSQSTRRDLHELYRVADSKVRVIPHANSLRLPASTNPPCDEKYILYVGRRDGYKNFDMLAQAYAASGVAADFRLICFGGGPINAAERHALASTNLADRVSMIGGDDAALANYYAHAAALVYPSKYEGFGIPPLEAMHYGCPVLAGAVSSIPEVAGDAAWYFDPSDRDDLCLKLRQLLSNADARARLAQAGRERERAFTWQRCARETFEFYESLLA